MSVEWLVVFRTLYFMFLNALQEDDEQYTFLQVGSIYSG